MLTRQDLIAPSAPRLAVPQVVVPLARLDRPTLGALAFARSISLDVTALHVAGDAAEGERMRRRWAERRDGIPLVIVESGRDGLIPHVVAYLDERARGDPERPLAIVLAHVVPRPLWSHLLQDQTTLRLKLRLFFRPNTVVVDVPYHV